MKTIASFSIDHTRLLRGIYVSRTDPVGNTMVTTFDIRMKMPNREPVLDVPVLHTLEHIGATFLRNHPVWGDRIVYFGPMGCRTGCYLLVQGDYSSRDILPVITEMFQFISGYEGEVHGATPKGCGNYLSQDLAMAKWESDKYLSETLLTIKPEQLVYPD